MKFNIYMNAGVEWTGEVYAETQEQAEKIAENLCQSELGNLSAYNFNVEVSPIN